MKKLRKLHIISLMLIFVLVGGLVAYAAVKRNYDGYATVASDDPLGQLPYLDPTKWAIFFDDFCPYDKAQGTGYYTFTQTNYTDALVGPTGVLTLTAAGAANDLGQLYLTDAPFQLTSGKKAVFECRCKVADATGVLGLQELVIGMTSVQTGANFMAADGLSRTFDDGMVFISYDAQYHLNCIQGENDTYSSENAASTYADDTWMILSIYYDGAKATYYKDNSEIAEISTNEPSSVITPMMFLKGGEAKAHVLHVDYILFAVER